MTPTDQAVLARLVAAARVLWVRLGDATDADVNQLGAAMIAATALLEAQKGKSLIPHTVSLPESRREATTIDIGQVREPGEQAFQETRTE